MPDLMAVAAAVLNEQVQVRDWGLLESALARPQATVFGEDAYPTVWDKPSALLMSLVGNHALVDGNKRVGFTAAILLLRKNGLHVVVPEDPAYDLVIDVAERRLLEVADVAAVLRAWAVPASDPPR